MLSNCHRETGNHGSAAMRDILVISLEVNHAMNETLLSGLVPSSGARNVFLVAGVALSDNRALPCR